MAPPTLKSFPRPCGELLVNVIISDNSFATACAAVLQSLPVSCHFRGCKAPLFRIVSGAISSELALPLPLPFGAICLVPWFRFYMG